MKQTAWLASFLAAMLPVVLNAGEVILKDSECRLFYPTEKSIANDRGDKSEYTCVVIGTEASCNYRSPETGKSQGEPTKYAVVDLADFQVWTSESGNIKLVLHRKAKRFFYGMTAVLLDKGTLVSKQCMGSIVRQAD